MYPTYTCLALFLVAESILASYCSVPMPMYLLLYPPLCIPFNKNSADAAEIILRFEMKNDGECKKLEKNAAS